MMHDAACELEAVKKHDVVPADALDRIRAFETELLKLPQLEVPLLHEFPDKLYARTIFMAAGSLFTTKVHKLDCYTIISQGDVSVFDKDGAQYRIQAPAMFPSKAGVKRALWVHEDTVWTTVHPNPDNLRDIVELERILAYSDREETV